MPNDSKAERKEEMEHSYWNKSILRTVLYLGFWLSEPKNIFIQATLRRVYLLLTPNGIRE